METAKANAEKPSRYLSELFDGLPTAASPEGLHSLTPFASPNG